MRGERPPRFARALTPQVPAGPARPGVAPPSRVTALAGIAVAGAVESCPGCCHDRVLDRFTPRIAIDVTAWPSRAHIFGLRPGPSRRGAWRRPLRGFGLDGALDAARSCNHVMAISSTALETRR